MTVSKQSQDGTASLCLETLDVHLVRWEIVWVKAPRIWRDFGSTLPFQTRLTQTKPVLPLSNEHGSQVKQQGRWQCCHNKHKKFPYRPTRDVVLLSGHASYSTGVFDILFVLVFYFVCSVFVLFCVLSLLLYIAVTFLLLYQSTDRSHQVETELQ
jgi:hypothetical protein